MSDMSYIVFESVGSVVDPNLGEVYPMCADGTPDLDMGVEFEGLSDEWLESLSQEDEITFKKILFHKNFK